MRIRELATHNGRAGSGGSWRSSHSNIQVSDRGMERNVHEIWHYSTLMLRWRTDNHGVIIPESVYASTGHGSVSDQGAMNQLFRALGLRLYFSRKGGADIIELD